MTSLGDCARNHCDSPSGRVLASDCPIAADGDLNNPMPQLARRPRTASQLLIQLTH